MNAARAARWHEVTTWISVLTVIAAAVGSFIALAGVAAAARSCSGHGDMRLSFASIAIGCAIIAPHLVLLAIRARLEEIVASEQAMLRAARLSRVREPRAPREGALPPPNASTHASVRDNAAWSLDDWED